MKNLTKNSSIDFINHQIIIEFTGGHYSEMIRGGTTHRVIVPYSCLSKKLQAIHRIGGKITNVSIPQLQLEMLTTNFEEITPIAQTTQTTAETVDSSVEISVAVENIPEEISEIVTEAVPEIMPDQVFNPVMETLAILLTEPVVTEPVLAVEDVIETIPESSVESANSATTLPKSKKSKTSTKSGHGFNKPR